MPWLNCWTVFLLYFLRVVDKYIPIVYVWFLLCLMSYVLVRNIFFVHTYTMLYMSFFFVCVTDTNVRNINVVVFLSYRRGFTRFLLFALSQCDNFFLFFSFKFPILLLLFFLDSAAAKDFQHRCIYESHICKPIYLQIHFKNWPYHSCIHLSLSLSIYLSIYLSRYEPSPIQKKSKTNDFV